MLIALMLQEEPPLVVFTLRKLCFHFLSHWMGYDRGGSFLIDFEPNGFSFGSKSKGKLSPRSYPIQCESKWKYSFLSVESLRWNDNKLFWDRVTFELVFAALLNWFLVPPVFFKEWASWPYRNTFGRMLIYCITMTY